MIFMKVDPFYDFGGRGCLGAGCGGGRLAGVPGRAAWRGSRALPLVPRPCVDAVGVGWRI